MTTNELEQPGTLETDRFLVRTMREDDLDAVVAIDAAATGRRRPRYFELMIERALDKADFQVSLVAEVEGIVAGCLIATIYYGEYGVVEPSASIDAVGVLPDFRGQQVGTALMRQLRLNLGALRIERVRTEVEWNDFGLLQFFGSFGFAPAGRLCLEYELDPTSAEA
jgi:ribosomal protein S18 acetylase RimI-like enzyme